MTVGVRQADLRVRMICCLAALTAGIVWCGSAHNVIGSLHAAEAGPRTSMGTMVDAMRAADPDRLLPLLPVDGSVTFVGTADQPWLVERVPAEALRQDFSTRTGYYVLLLDAGPDDSFRDVFQATRFAPWVTQDGVTFTPPGESFEDGRFFVRWRREGEQWLVDAIGQPGS
jgi:hypothetical protein